jgi:ParB/RepB/Spo0J family partition protein
MNIHRTVSLPDGERVEISNTECPWWSTQNGSGFVGPELCAPDSEQPRQHMTATGLTSLRKSTKQAGIRESLVVTPRHLAPWVMLSPEFAHAYFVIVSGQRRWISGIRSGVKAVPIRVRIYRSERHHYLDASLLNSNREDLTPLEWGMDILRLQKVGWTIRSLCDHYGKSAPYLQMRVHLTRLAPDIQKGFDPRLRDKDLLPITVGGALGQLCSPTAEELGKVLKAFGEDARSGDDAEVVFETLDDDDRRFELQRMFLRVILKRRMNVNRAVRFLRRNTRLLRIGQSFQSKRSLKLKPARRRAILGAYLDRIVDSAVNDWRPMYFCEMLGDMPDDEADLLLERFEQARQSLEGLEALVRGNRKTVE